MPQPSLHYVRTGNAEIIHEQDLIEERSMRRCGVARFLSDHAMKFIVAILIIGVFSLPGAAQTGSVNLKGTVWDVAGNLFPGAVLNAVEEYSGQQFEAVSDENGDYRFLALPPGFYSISLKAKGFKNLIHRNIALLMPGTVEEFFTVEAAAADEEISTYETPQSIDSGNAGAFSREELQARPLLDRNPLSQTIFQPGVLINGGNEGSSSVNGTRTGMNSTIMDGISITDPVSPTLGSSVLTLSPEYISDLQIVSAGGKAEYGRSGGGQFVLSSRPGTKSWTGTVYDYFRNTNLNANDFFTNAYGLNRPSITKNLFGAVVSGPVYRDKTLLFANFEGNRTNQQINKNRLVLTPEAKSGTFRWYIPGDTDRVLQSYDIVGIDPVIASTLEKLPNPNNYRIGDGLNTAGYRFNSHTHFNQDRIAARVDHRLNSNRQLFFRMNWDRVDATDTFNNADATFPGQQSGIFAQNNWGFTAGMNWTLNPQMVNELRFGFIQPKTDLKRPARTQAPMQIANSWTNPLDTSSPRSFSSRNFEIADNMSHSKSQHLFKYGLDYRRIRQQSDDYSGVSPNVTFGVDHGNAPASTVGPSEQLLISTGDRLKFEKLYNDLLGRIESVSQTYNSSLTTVLPAGTSRKRSFSSQELAGFFQDDWRILSNLTLNLGVRFELSTSPKESNGYQSVLNKDFVLNNSANISDFSVGAGDSMYKNSLKNIAPRAGFAWDIFGTGRTVLRGSYGIYYDRLIGAITNYINTNGYGLSQTAYQYPNLEGGDQRLSGGIPNVPVPAALPLNVPMTRAYSVAVFDPNIKAPRIYQYNLTLEKKLGAAVLQVGYVGTRGKNLFQYLNLNQTKTPGDFLKAFRELQDYRNNGTALPDTNVFKKIFADPGAALDAVGGSIVDSNQVGLAADTLDRGYHDRYAAAGIPDTYIRNFPQFNKFIVGTSTGESWYNSLQAGLRVSGKSYHMRAHYTWSKSIDTMSSDGAVLVNPVDSFNVKSDRAPSDFDRKHVFNLAWDFKVPFGRSWSQDSQIPRWMDSVFGNWSLGILYIRESGARYSVYSGLETAYAGVNSYADFSGDRSIGEVIREKKYIRWLSIDETTSFTVPDAGTTGTSGRNAFVGPSYVNLDVSLFKKFQVNDKQDVQLRIEAYNVFNKAHFGQPDGNISNATTFGTINSTVGTPRFLQVALRYQF
jgi:hypothetical protein